jgi:hypothetical protein
MPLRDYTVNTGTVPVPRSILYIHPIPVPVHDVGPNILQIMQNIWINDYIIPKQRQYYGNFFKAERGV